MEACRTGHRSRAARLGRCLALGAALAVPVALAGTPAARAASPQDRLAVGLKAYRDGFHDLASTELRAFLRAAPGDPRRADALEVLAHAEMARSDWKGARSALEELRAAGGAPAREAGYWLGWVAARAGSPGDALALLDRYLEAKDGDHRADALFLAAELSAGVEGPQRRAERCERFLREAPGDRRRPAAWAGRVEGSRASGPGAVRSVVAAALADPGLRGDAAALEAVALAGVEAARQQGDPDGEAALWAALAAGAGDRGLRGRALCEEGLARARTGAPAGARAALEACLRESPKGPLAPRAHVALANVAAGEGDAAGALRHLEAALAKPGDPAVKGRELELRKAALAAAGSAGDLAGAKRHGAALLAREGELSPGERGVVRLALAAAAGGLDEALSRWDGIPPEAPQYEEARLLAARRLAAAGRAREALARLDPLLARGEASAEVLLEALSAAEASADPSRAAELCGRLASAPPPGHGAPEFLERRARHLQTLGDEGGYARALEAVARSGDRDRAAAAAGELADRAFRSRDWGGVLRWAPRARGGPERGRAAYQEAEALWALGRADEARAALAALGDTAGPFQATALARLGATLEAAGRRDEALAAYRRAMESGLDGEAAEAVRARLGAAGSR